MFNAGRCVDCGFDNAGDAGIDHIRISAAQGGVYYNDGEVNCWDAVYADALVRNDAE